VRRTCAESTLTHTVGSDSGSSKCSRNTSKAAPLAAYTVGRETPEKRLSPQWHYLKGTVFLIKEIERG
jgi:hypothetical protein